MSENKMGGVITISDEVIGLIAVTAALEVEGVVGQSAKTFSEFFSRKNQTRCVKIAQDEKEVVLDMDVVVNFGTKVQEVAAQVQDKVKSAVETMTGLTVPVVNVYVFDIVKESAEEMFEQE